MGPAGRSTRRLVDVIDPALCRVRQVCVPRGFELSGLDAPPLIESRNDVNEIGFVPWILLILNGFHRSPRPSTLGQLARCSFVVQKMIDKKQSQAVNLSGTTIVQRGENGSTKVHREFEPITGP